MGFEGIVGRGRTKSRRNGISEMLSKMRAHEESMAENQDDQDSSSSDDGDGVFNAEDGTVEEVKNTNKKHGEL